MGTGVIGNAYQGVSVSLNADGNTAMVGGLTDNSGQGAAWVFTRSGGIWTQQGSKLVGTGNTGAANQGVSVSLSADGNTAIVGGYADNASQGAAWVYISRPPVALATLFPARFYQSLTLIIRIIIHGFLYMTALEILQHRSMLMEITWVQ